MDDEASALDDPEVFCGRHGRVSYAYWDAETQADGIASKRKRHPFCGMCFGEWLSQQFPVKERR